MLNRGNSLLIALLAVQLAALLFSVMTAGGGEARAIEKILANLAIEEIDRFHFADDLGNALSFARRADGWALPEADDFPVDGAKVEELLGKIAALDTRRLVAANPANFARLEVGDEKFRRKLRLEGGDASADLILGGGAGGVYVRRGGENKVYLGFGLSSWELSTQISTWVDASYVNVPQADLIEITVENADGSFTFLQDGETWRYAGLREGEEFEDTKMPIIARNAAAIRLQEPLGLEALPEYALEEPRAVVTVRYRLLVEPEPALDGDARDDAANADETAELDDAEREPEFSEASYALTFGAELEGGIALKSSDADYYVLVRDTVFKAFHDIAREDLIRAPDPIEAAAEAAGGE